jgi:hypothetical protein
MRATFDRDIQRLTLCRSRSNQVRGCARGGLLTVFFCFVWSFGTLLLEHCNSDPPAFLFGFGFLGDELGALIHPDGVLEALRVGVLWVARGVDCN